MERQVESLAQRVKTKRRERGLTQGQLAKLSDLKQPDISKIELGRIEKTTGIARLADALGVSVRWLEIGDGPPNDVPGTAVDLRLSEEDKTFLEDFRILPTDEQERLRADVRQRAEKFREYLKQHLGRAGPAKR